MERRPKQPFTAAPDTKQDPPLVAPKPAVEAPEFLLCLVRSLARNAAAIERSKVTVHVDIVAAGIAHPCNSNAI